MMHSSSLEGRDLRDHYELEPQKIGEGAFGVVCKCHRKAWLGGALSASGGVVGRCALALSGEVVCSGVRAWGAQGCSGEVVG